MLTISNRNRTGHTTISKLRLLGLGLLQKISKADRIVLEDIATASLVLIIGLYNVLIYRNCKVGLKQDEPEQPSELTKVMP